MSARLRRVLISALVLTGLWQLLAMWVGHSFILPAPLQVISAMLALLKEASFYSALSATIVRSLLALVLAFVSAALAAWLSWKKQLFADLFSPLLMIMRSVPNISYILLILYWFSRDISSVIISFLILFRSSIKICWRRGGTSTVHISMCCASILGVRDSSFFTSISRCFGRQSPPAFAQASRWPSRWASCPRSWDRCLMG